MSEVSGTVHIDHVTDSEMALVYEFKASHEHRFTFDVEPCPPPQDDPAPQSSVVIGWKSIRDLDLLVKFLDSIEKHSRPIMF